MARLNTYPRNEYINTDDAFVIDGPHGTRSVSVQTVMNYIPEAYVTQSELNETIGDDTMDDIDFSEYFLKENIAVIPSGATGETILGKPITDLQANVSFSKPYVYGTLKWVEGFTGFSKTEELQSGNFLAFEISRDESIEDVDVVFSYSNSQKGNVHFDSDKNAVVRVIDSEGDLGTITIIAQKRGDTYTASYDLNRLTLEEKGDA